jgi:hypothetical protein
MVDPNTVDSPRDLIKQLDVVFQCEDENYAIATAMKDGEPRMMIRWNGTGTELGYPNAFGKPVWFDLPNDLALHIAKTFYKIPTRALRFLEGSE